MMAFSHTIQTSETNQNNCSNYRNFKQKLLLISVLSLRCVLQRSTVYVATQDKYAIVCSSFFSSLSHLSLSLPFLQTHTPSIFHANDMLQHWKLKQTLSKKLATIKAHSENFRKLSPSSFIWLIWVKLNKKTKIAGQIENCRTSAKNIISLTSAVFPFTRERKGKIVNST